MVATYDLTRAVDRALRHVEVSAASRCAPVDFAEALRTGTATGRAHEALRLFLEEGDEQMLVDLVTEGATSFECLGGLAQHPLPAGHPTTASLSAPPT